MATVPAQQRVVEVIATLGVGQAMQRRYGSGLLIGGRSVLTSAHVVVGAVDVLVRRPDKSVMRADLETALIGDPDPRRLDLAILEVPEAEELPYVPVALVDRTSGITAFIDGCAAVGYPQFQEVVRDPSGLSLRETAQVRGAIAPLSGLVEHLLSLEVTATPRELPPAGTTLSESAWAGMSGAAVFAPDAQHGGEVLVGVVAEHAPRRGQSSISVLPLDRLRDMATAPVDASKWWTRLGIAAPQNLPSLTPAKLDGSSEKHQESLHQLPVDLPDFVGRSREESILLAPTASTGETAASDVRIVFGPGGVGKTSLVVHVIERNLAEFRDGQLYANLQGYGKNPLSPAEVLDGWLRDLGVEGYLIPTGLEERSRTFRSRLAGKRMAVVIDNAENETQVRPLLVPGGGSVNFITSRNALAGVAANIRLELDVLSATESVELLSRILGKDRVQAEATPAEHLAKASGYLPLALRVVGGRLLSDPRPLDDFLARLEQRRKENRGLEVFAIGDLSVEATLALSREHLTAGAQTAFDRLGLHPADEWSDWSVAALYGCSVFEAQELLDEQIRAELVKVRTLSPRGVTRYYMHDLIREFARDQAAENLADERDAALSRLASAYLSMADLADRSIHPSGVRHQGRTLAPRYPLDPNDAEAAVSNPYSWFRSEQAAIIAVVAECHRSGQWLLCWELSDAASVAFENLRIWDTAVRCAELGFDAAAQVHSDAYKAASLRNLGEIDRELGKHDRAIQRLEESVRLFDDIGDLFGATDARINLALVQLRWGDPLIADSTLSAALAKARKAEDARGEAWGLEIRGECAMVLGRPAEGRRDLQDAARVFESTGERRGLAMARFNEALLIIDDMGWVPLPQLDKDSHLAVNQDNAARASTLLDQAGELLAALGDARNMSVVELARIRLKVLECRNEEAARDVRKVRSLEGFELDRHVRGLLLHCESILEHRSGSLGAARDKCKEAVSFVQPYGDRISIACMTLHLGILARTAGDEDDAQAQFALAHGLFREIRRNDGAELCERLITGSVT